MAEPSTEGLRLVAETADDMPVIAAAVQDAVAQVGDVAFDARRRRFTVAMNRFRWELDGGRSSQRYERVRALLAVDGVRKARARGLTKADPEMVVSLLTVSFEPGETPPEGTVTLLFAGDGEIALEVECLDVTLLDTGLTWSTPRRPDHERGRK